MIDGNEVLQKNGNKVLQKKELLGCIEGVLLGRWLESTSSPVSMVSGSKLLIQATD